MTDPKDKRLYVATQLLSSVLRADYYHRAINSAFTRENARERAVNEALELADTLIAAHDARPLPGEKPCK